MSKNRSSSSSSSNGSSNGNDKNSGFAMVNRTQNNAALSTVSPDEAAFLSSLSAEEFNALIEERSEVARGI